MTTNEFDDYMKAAQNTFQLLRARFVMHPIFWQLGHSLDTMIDYLAINPADATGFTEIALRKYLDRQSLVWRDGDEGKDPWWYDDYGWWGIAGLKASQHPEIFGTYAPCFRGISNLCWQAIYRNAPHVWENADKDRFKVYEPRFDGGVWNYFFSEKKIADIPFTPCWPGGQDGLRGTQNTVTNGLYWVLASRLYEVTGDSHYRDASDTEYQFINNWLNVEKPDESLLYYYNPNDRSKVLVRERVSTYANGKHTYNYREDLAWLGDQGLILGGLVDRMSFIGNDSPEYHRLLDIAKAITDGVKDKMSKEGILLPWVPYTNKPDHGAPGGDVDDYMTGIGVYMRYLLYAYQNNSNLRAYLQETDYPDIVRKNVYNVIEEPKNQLIRLSNKLATLVAAIFICE